MSADMTPDATCPVQVWRVEDWAEIASTGEPFKKGFITMVFSLRLSWSPDGQTLAVVNSFDPPSHNVALLDRQTWEGDTFMVGHQGGQQLPLNSVDFLGCEIAGDVAVGRSGDPLGGLRLGQPEHAERISLLNSTFRLSRLPLSGGSESSPRRLGRGMSGPCAVQGLWCGQRTAQRCFSDRGLMEALP